MTTKAIKTIIASVFLVFAFVPNSWCQSEDVFVNKEAAKGKSYKKIFIFAQAKDIQARVRVENAMAKSATGRGYTVVKSIDVIPPSLQDTSLPSREKVLEAIRSSECDGVFAIKLLRKEDRLDYKKGGVGYSKVPIYTWNGGLFGYYSDMALTTNTKDVYTNIKEYFILSNLFDVSTQQLIFSVESQVVDPTDVDRAVNAYMADVLKKLEKKKLIRKKPDATNK